MFSFLRVLHLVGSNFFNAGFVRVGLDVAPEDVFWMDDTEASNWDHLISSFIKQSNPEGLHGTKEAFFPTQQPHVRIQAPPIFFLFIA